MTSPHPTLSPFVRKRGWREGANNITHYYIVDKFSNNQKQPHPQPLPVGEGSEYPHLLLENRYWMLENRYWVLENRAQRPCSTMVSMANLSRTVASVPRPPATK